MSCGGRKRERDGGGVTVRQYQAGLRCGGGGGRGGEGAADKKASAFTRLFHQKRERNVRVNSTWVEKTDMGQTAVRQRESFHTGCAVQPLTPSPDAKRAQKTAVSGAGGLRGTCVVGLEERVPRAEAVSVEVSFDDQGRLFLLEGVAHFAEEAAPRFERVS